jgi:hypothetical protein
MRRAWRQYGPTLWQFDPKDGSRVTWEAYFVVSGSGFDPMTGKPVSRETLRVAFRRKYPGQLECYGRRVLTFDPKYNKEPRASAEWR